MKLAVVVTYFKFFTQGYQAGLHPFLSYVEDTVLVLYEFIFWGKAIIYFNTFGYCISVNDFIYKMFIVSDDRQRLPGGGGLKKTVLYVFLSPLVTAPAPSGGGMRENTVFYDGFATPGEP